MSGRERASATCLPSLCHSNEEEKCPPGILKREGDRDTHPLSRSDSSTESLRGTGLPERRPAGDGKVCPRDIISAVLSGIDNRRDERGSGASQDIFLQKRMTRMTTNTTNFQKPQLNLGGRC